MRKCSHHIQTRTCLPIFAKKQKQKNVHFCTGYSLCCSYILYHHDVDKSPPWLTVKLRQVSHSESSGRRDIYCVFRCSSLTRNRLNERAYSKPAWPCFRSTLWHLFEPGSCPVVLHRASLVNWAHHWVIPHLESGRWGKDFLFVFFNRCGIETCHLINRSYLNGIPRYERDLGEWSLNPNPDPFPSLVKVQQILGYHLAFAGIVLLQIWWWKWKTVLSLGYKIVSTLGPLTWANSIYWQRRFSNNIK